MANANLKLISALRRTASKLENGNSYQWGHMGKCNCGNLAQELTEYSSAQIHEYALLSRSGDWSEQTSAYCGITKLPLDWVVDAMLDSGLDINDLKNLEYLSDSKVLKRFPMNERNLKHNVLTDLVKYLITWADMLEEELLSNIVIEDVFQLQEN